MHADWFIADADDQAHQRMCERIQMVQLVRPQFKVKQMPASSSARNQPDGADSAQCLSRQPAFTDNSTASAPCSQSLPHQFYAHHSQTQSHLNQDTVLRLVMKEAASENTLRLILCP